MKPTIETREIVRVDTGENRLWGTHHKPQNGEADSTPAQENPIGVLCFCGGVLPRAAAGDSAVYWADSFARCGYHAFRFDLPGIGDSSGVLPKDESGFLSLVNAGAYAPAVSGIAKHLVERFHLRGLVVVAHCSGAVAALYSATADENIKGAILLNPYFHAGQQSEIQNALVRWEWRIIRRLAWDRPAQSNLRDAAVNLLSSVRNVYRRMKDIRPVARQRKLPSTANLALTRCWKQLATTGLPMLVLRSPSAAPKPGEFDYVADLQPLSNPDGGICVELIEGTTHVFSNQRGKEAVRKCIEHWLSAHFPPTEDAQIRDREHYSPVLADASDVRLFTL